ncbi:MAG TPA: hypothetical protein V6C91_14525, partial [Coleofasciculaceae cyanobacterium]
MTQKLIEWRQQYKELRHQSYTLDNGETGKHQTLSLASSTTKTVKRDRGVYTVVVSCFNGKRSPVVFAIAVLSLTGVLGQKLYNQPQLQIGAIAPQTIRAPEEARIEDKKKTEEQRKAASTSSAPVLMVNAQINEEIQQNLQQILYEGNSIRSSLGAFPFFDTFILSVSTQRYVRSCSHWEWQALLIAVNNNKKHKQGLSNKENRNLGIEDLKTNNLFHNPDFAQAVQELETYHLSTSDQNLSSLIAQIIKVRQGYAEANTKLSDLIGAKPETVYDAVSLLDISDDDWAKTQVGIQQTAQKILTQGIPPGLPPYIIKDAVSLHVQNLVPKEAEPLTVKLLLAVLKPNLQTDKLRTQLTAAKAVAGVKPVMVTVRKGELIVRRGEKITAFDFEVLEHYRLIRREINWQGLIQLGITVTGAVGFFA